VFVEALYAQLPVVTSDMGGPCEIIDDSCGVKVPPGDLGSLAIALRQLIEDPILRARLGSAGPIRAKNVCDPYIQLRQFESALESLTCRRQAIA
jgi:glycosyltransferase involved in cell wall biosynthesis